MTLPPNRVGVRLGHGAWALLYAGLFMAFYVAPIRHAWLGCPSRMVLGYPCPFCGTVRSFHWMAHGQVGEAFVNSPLAALVFLAVPALLGWHLLQACRPATDRAAGSFRFLTPGRFWLCMTGLVLLNWLYRLGRGFD